MHHRKAQAELGFCLAKDKQSSIERGKIECEIKVENGIDEIKYDESLQQQRRY